MSKRVQNVYTPRRARRQATPVGARRVALAAGTLAAVSLLSGCGPSGPSSAGPAQPTNTPAVATPTVATPAATAAPTTGAATTAAPPTTSLLAPRNSSYEVGAYYFSGWSHGQNDNINPLLTGRFHTSEPLIGWYDDSQSVVDKSITQAANAGIDFFAFDWYDIKQSPFPTDQTLNEALGFYLKSTQRHRLKFSLVWVDHAPFVPTPDHPAAVKAWPAKEWPRLIDAWIPLFKQPDYVRVNGKPLLTIFSPEHLREVFGGSAAVRAGLEELRRRVRAAGLPGVTIAVAATVVPTSNPIKVQELNTEGYDVATGYNYHSIGGERYRVPTPYAHLVAENAATWDRVASGVHLPYMPVITSGWDQSFSYREQATAIIYAGRTPAQFACYAVRARHWVDTHPGQTTKEHIVMLYAWNEIGEGGALIPNHKDGYAYTEAIRTVFGGDGQPPMTPTDCRA